MVVATSGCLASFRMKHVPNKGQPAELAGLASDDLPTAQESIPAPYFAGVRKLKLLWITEPLDRFTKKAKDEGAKK